MTLRELREALEEVSQHCPDDYEVVVTSPYLNDYRYKIEDINILDDKRQILICHDDVVDKSIN